MLEDKLSDFIARVEPSTCAGCGTSLRLMTSKDPKLVRQKIHIKSRDQCSGIYEIERRDQRSIWGPHYPSICIDSLHIWWRFHWDHWERGPISRITCCPRSWGRTTRKSSSQFWLKPRLSCFRRKQPKEEESPCRNNFRRGLQKLRETWWQSHDGPNHRLICQPTDARFL